MMKRERLVRHASILITYILIVWGFYRFLFKLPEEIEEIIIKPLVWLLPVIYLVKREGANSASLGISSKNIYSAVFLSLLLGAVFAVEGLFVNFVKYKGIDFSANIGENPFVFSLMISFATAVSEEITFRGYLFSRILLITGNELKANIITTLFWVLVHVPITIFWWELDLVSVLIYLLLTTFFGLASSFIFARTKNIVSSILLHILWEWPIILFR